MIIRTYNETPWTNTLWLDSVGRRWYMCRAYKTLIARLRNNKFNQVDIR